MSKTKQIDGYEWMVTTVEPSGTKHVSRREGREPWAPLTRAQLLELPKGGDVWAWLREQAVRRPSPSGRSGRTQTAEDRRAAGRRRIDTWVSEEAGARLDELADGRTLAETLEAIIMSAKRRK